MSFLQKSRGADRRDLVRELLGAFEQAASRRAKAGWDGAARAQAAVQALRADAKVLSGLAEPLGALQQHFGLDDDAAKLLLTMAISEYVVSGQIAAGALSGDEKPARLSVAMGLEIAGLLPTASTAYHHLGPLSPLVSSGLVDVPGDDPLLSRRLVIAPRVLAHLAHEDQPPVSILSTRMKAVPVAAEGTGAVAAALDDGATFIWVHSPVGAAGPSLAAAAAEQIGVPWYAADLGTMPEGLSADDVAADLIMEAALRGAALILVGAERVTQLVLDRAPLPVIAVSTDPWDVSRSATLPVVVQAKRLSLAQRSVLWERMLGRPIDREIAALRLTAEQIYAAAEHAWSEGQEVGPEDLRAAARLLGKAKSGRATSADPVTLDDLVLPAHTLTEVRRLLNWARYRDDVTALGALHGKGGKGTGISALFAGKPGTGKTLAAHVIADALAMDLYQVEISTVVDKYIGETEKNLEKVFTAAESMNAVLFFDEADAIFGSRSEVRDARDRYANQEVAYLLQRMEQFDGITILATNLRGNLDAAFMRRLHFMITFPDPDEETRRVLWEQHLAPAGELDAEDPPDVAMLARTVDLAGGEIRNIVLAATYDCVAEGTPLGQRHLARAVTREYVKLGRVLPSAYAR